MEVEFPRVTFRVFRDDKLGEDEESSDASCDGAHDGSGGGGRGWVAAASGPMVFSTVSL